MDATQTLEQPAENTQTATVDMGAFAAHAEEGNSGTPLTDWFLGREKAEGGMSEGEDPAVTAAAQEEGSEEGEPAPVEAEEVEFKFGQKTFKVPAALKAMAQDMDKTVRAIQSTADKSKTQLENQVSALNQKIEAFIAGQGGQGSAGHEQSRSSASSPAAYAGPAEDIYDEAKQLDEEIGAQGKLAGLIRKLGDRMAGYAEHTALFVKDKVDQEYGTAIRLTQLEETLAAKIEKQIEFDSEDPILGDIVSQTTAEELAPLIANEIKAAVKSGRSYNEKEIYMRVLFQKAKDGAHAQVSKPQQISGNASRNGATGNGQRSAASGSGASGSGGLGKTAKMPQTLRSSAGRRTVEDVQREVESAFDRHRPSF